jgi:hypothetical protein
MLANERPVVRLLEVFSSTWRRVALPERVLRRYRYQ